MNPPLFRRPIHPFEESTVSALLSRQGDCSLSSGVAGALLLESRLHSVEPTEQRRVHIESAIDILIHSIQSQDLQINLWAGMVGVLYALEYTKAVCPDLIEDRVDSFVSQMDDMLVGYLTGHRATLHFDLVSGLVGFGAYALMRTSSQAGALLYQTVEETLLARAEGTPDGLRWRTMPRHLSPIAAPSARQMGHIDFGIAHGQPGVVLLLAAGLRNGLTRDEAVTRSGLEQATSFLMASQQSDLAHSRYPYYQPQSHNTASRLAWCYGDVGVGFALHSAGLAIDSPGLKAFGSELVEARMNQPDESFALSDTGLCHGTLGVVHLVNKMLRDSRSEKTSALLASWRAVQPASHLEYGYHQQPDLLDGTAGVLLALTEEPGEGWHRWDTCLCLGF